MSKLHSYPWYPADWRGSETRMAMTLEERAIYRDLLDHCWEEGSLPTNPRVLAGIAGASAEEWERCGENVLAPFEFIDGRYHHRKVNERRPELVEWHEARKQAGRKGAESRWQKDGSAIAQPSHSHSSPNGKPMASRWPSTSSSTSSSIESGVQHLQDSDTDPDPPPKPTPPQKAPIPKPNPAGLRRITRDDLPKIPDKAIADTLRAFAPKLPDPGADANLLRAIAGELDRAGMGPDDLGALLRPKRETIRKANGWGLVITLVEVACRDRPLGPRKHPAGRIVYPGDPNYDAGLPILPAKPTPPLNREGIGNG